MRAAFQFPVMFAAAISLSASALGEDTETKTVRIGVYDSRAIALAYAPSKFNPVAAKMRDYEKAKAEGNEQLMKELENWGQKHQRQLHRQGFSVVPVADLLEHVKDKLPDVAREADVVAITRACDHVADSVQTVDVTQRIVNLFDPSDETLKRIQDIMTKQPVDLDQIDRPHSD